MPVSAACLAKHRGGFGSLWQLPSLGPANGAASCAGVRY
jgi:hypothetical protein